MSQVFEDCHCLKRNTHTSLDLSSVILHEIWRCHVFGKPKQPKKRLMWFKTGYASPLITKINGLMHGIFEVWQRQRLLKVPIIEIVGLLKNYDYHHVGVMSLIFKLE